MWRTSERVGRVQKIKRRDEERSHDIEKMTIAEITKAIQEEKNQNQEKQQDKGEQETVDVEKLRYQIVSLSAHLERTKEELWEHHQQIEVMQRKNMLNETEKRKEIACLRIV